MSDPYQALPEDAPEAGDEQGPSPDTETADDAGHQGLRPLVGGTIPREIPVRLGRYLIDNVIGRGAMGVVYRARQEGLNRTVALKVLLEGEHASEARRKRFEREARAIAKLHHPNIVTVHEVGEYQGQPFFSMDLIEGMALDQFAKKVGLTSSTIIADLCATIADAVAYAHDQGILHRDLKPSNILVNNAGQPIITDFGLAKDMDSESMLSVAGDIMGTPAFMSPEQAGGRVEDTDARSDVYALGAILYSLLTRKPPFEGKTVVETLTKVLHEEPASFRITNPHVEGELGAICMKAMEKEPARRYPSAEAFADDLRNFINGYPVTARPRTWRRSLQLFTRRRRKEIRWAAAAAALLLVVGVAAPLFFSRAYLDVARTHLGSPDPAVRADAVATLGREIIQPEELDQARRGEAARLIMTAAGDEDPAVRAALLAFLAEQAGAGPMAGAIDDQAAAWLIAEANQKQDPRRRDLALETMGRVSNQAFRKYLVQRLNEPNPAVRIKVVRSLGGQHTIHAVAPLINLMNSDPLCRAEAQAALDRIYAEGSFSPFTGTDRAVKHAMQGLTQAMAQHDAQLEAVLRDIDGGEAGRPEAEPEGPLSEFERALRSGDPAERMRAVYELGMAGDPAAVPTLLEALRDDDPRVGAAAALALTRAGGPGVIDELQRRILSEETATARGNAALAMGFTGSRTAVDPLLVALAQERDLGARRMIVQALGELGEAHAVPGLRRAAEQESRLAPDVERALLRIGSE